MEGLNFPTAVDWFNGALLSLVLAIVAATINKAVTSDMSAKKAVIIVFSTLTVAIFALALWYNFVGYIIFLQAKDLEERHGCNIAFPVYLNAVQSNPKLTNARENFVNCGLRIGKVDESIKTLNTVSPILFTKWLYWKEMAELYSYDNDEEKMYYAVSRIVDLHTYENRKAIIEEVSESARNYPKNSMWISALGEEFHDNWDYSMAEAILRIVRINNGSDANALFWLAWSLYEQKEYSDALNHFDECIKQIQEFDELAAGRCYAGKGFIYFDEGQIIKAKESFIKALELNPNQEDVIEKLQLIP